MSKILGSFLLCLSIVTIAHPMESERNLPLHVAPDILRNIIEYGLLGESKVQKITSNKRNQKCKWVDQKKDGHIPWRKLRKLVSIKRTLKNFALTNKAFHHKIKTFLNVENDRFAILCQILARLKTDWLEIGTLDLILEDENDLLPLTQKDGPSIIEAIYICHEAREYCLKNGFETLDEYFYNRQIFLIEAFQNINMTSDGTPGYFLHSIEKAGELSSFYIVPLRIILKLRGQLRQQYNYQFKEEFRYVSPKNPFRKILKELSLPYRVQTELFDPERSYEHAFTIVLESELDKLYEKKKLSQKLSYKNLLSIIWAIYIARKIHATKTASFLLKEFERVINGVDPVKYPGTIAMCVFNAGLCDERTARIITGIIEQHCIANDSHGQMHQQFTPEDIQGITFHARLITVVN